MLVLLALCFAAPAAANHVQCGDTITQNTTLDSDLVCSGDGLTAEAGGITLDLAGHTLQGPLAFSVGVNVLSFDHVTIRNGTISGFSRGVDTDGARGTTLRNMVLQRNGAGLHCQYAPECRVEDSVIHDNDTGIEVDAADGGDLEPTVVQRNLIRDNGTGLTITGQAGLVADNRIEHNTGDGIRNDYGLPVHILSNVVSDNGDEGVRIFYLADATVAANRIIGNAGNGVGVHGSGGEFGDTTATVSDNRIERSGGDGVLVEGRGVTALVERNQSDRNGDDGIDVDFGPYTPDPDCCFEVTVRANKAFFNSDLGIEAAQGTAAGTTDGGGNKARHNGNPAQCVGVRCR
jgi:hypothetical protein